MELDYGNRESPVLIVTDVAQDDNHQEATGANVLSRNGAIYNGLVVPLKYYLNQYLILNSPMRLVSETVAQEPFHYAAAVESSRDRRRQPNLLNLRNVLLAVNPVVILTLGEYAYQCSQQALGTEDVPAHLSAAQLGEVYRQNMIKLRFSENEGKAVLPLLGREYFADSGLGDAFIGEEDPALFISYFHYLGCTLGRLFLDLSAQKQYRWNHLMLKQ